MEFREIDGTGNNKSHADFNAVNTDFMRLGEAEFSGGGMTPRDGPNAREISNLVVGQGDAAVENPQGLSGMMYAWGQFIDHDLDLISSGTTHFDITVPVDDQVFQPGTVIPLTRAETDPKTGNPINAITGWLDASMVYGSDAAAAESLRQPDGHMRTSSGGNLPISDGHFVAGDSRAAENPSLTALQTLFVREHNFQVDRLHAEDPNLTGDELYQQARAITTAEIEHITYDEFLPHLLGGHALSNYKGYDPGVDPRISVEFTAAAYRFGHSAVSAETEKLDEQGNVVGGTLSLRDAFFQSPQDFAADSGSDGLLRHLAADLSQAMDVRIVDDLRNGLFDPPAVQDLAAINIQRGRDVGLPHLNEMRASLGLEPYTAFDQITDDAGTATALQQAYGSVDAIDLWTGGLAEKVVPGAFLGSTFQSIVADQFERLRDGDRLWYENQGFDADTLQDIRNTSLKDIILRDTDTHDLQDDIFVFAERRTAGTEPEHPGLPQLIVPDWMA